MTPAFLDLVPHFCNPSRLKTPPLQPFTRDFSKRFPAGVFFSGQPRDGRAHGPPKLCLLTDPRSFAFFSLFRGNSTVAQRFSQTLPTVISPSDPTSRLRDPYCFALFFLDEFHPFFPFSLACTSAIHFFDLFSFSVLGTQPHPFSFAHSTCRSIREHGL